MGRSEDVLCDPLPERKQTIHAAFPEMTQSYYELTGGSKWFRSSESMEIGMIVLVLFNGLMAQLSIS